MNNVISCFQSQLTSFLKQSHKTYATRETQISQSKQARSTKYCKISAIATL